jgi:ectoine hydroxylase-related dioxygenase (phytanoyl-CoA dioxygenase family)
LTLQGLNWHRDIAQSKLCAIPGVQAFVLLDDLSPHGGATLALAGSQRLQMPSGGMQSIARLIKDGSDGTVVVDGIRLSILEMTGKAGDVYLMDMRVIHTPSINAGRNVRMMATMRYLTA